MNRQNDNKPAPATARTPTSASNRFRIAGPAWQQVRQRDFGVGYGNSSGYASDRRYADDWGQDRFRMA